MEETIHGTTMPVLELSLQPGESIVSEAGEFSWMSDAVQMQTNTGGGMGGKGIMGAVKRAVSGSSFMMTTYTAEGGPGSVAFASKVPGHILPIDVSPGNEFMVHKHGFMAGTPGIELSMGFQQSFRGGIFGGEGFILQKIAGSGRAFVDLSGEVIVYDLQPGQTMRVHPGHAGLFQASVTFSVQKVPGLANRYMGSDGHHFAVMTGPGRIWLQSMPLPLLAGVIGEYLPDRDDHHGVEGAAAGIGAAKVLGDMFK
ncbi:MAG TPA: TIGR00266 family protein [Acidimicrobiales bacterium]|nr:TIGR00266 family protein [Acidimicrobiales bacterium]